MKIVFAAVVAMTALAAPSANAQTTPTARVSYADLDIHSSAGQTTLKSRSEHAARNVCGSFNSDFDLASRTSVNRCYRAAIGDAMNQLNARAPQYASR